jgi:hypothetical protein
MVYLNLEIINQILCIILIYFVKNIVNKDILIELVIYKKIIIKIVSVMLK